MQQFHCRYDRRVKRWVACTAGDAVAHRVVTIPYAPVLSPGTFVNPRHVLARTAGAICAVMAYQERMGL